jgi:hypothetical protein
MAGLNEQHVKHTLATLRCVHYDRWGSTDATPLPIQTGTKQKHAVLVRQLIRGLLEAEPSLQRMEADLEAIFLRPTMESLVQDLYWITFLEYFALIDAESRLERHKKLIVSQFEQEEQDAQRAAQRRRNSRTFFLRRRAMKQQQQDVENKGEKSLLPNDDRERSHIPRHLRCTTKATGIPSRPSSAQSTSSRAESVCSVLSATSDATAATALLDELMTLPPEAYEGRIEMPSVVRVLLSADIVTSQAAKTAISGVDEQSVMRQETFRRAAVDLIRTEQEHMLDRLAGYYVALFRTIKSVKRDAVLGPLPDALGQLVMSLFHRTLPYMRNEINTRTKRLLKRRISYWFSGVENGEVRKWAQPTESSLVAAPMLADMPASQKPSRRSSIANTSGSTPALPSLDAASKWRSAGAKAKLTGIAMTGFSEAGEMHNPVFTQAYMAMRKELRHILVDGHPPALVGAQGPDTWRDPKVLLLPTVPAPPPTAMAATARGPRPSAQHTDMPRHAVTHRFAIDPRPPRWHETGRRREARLLAHDNARHFDSAQVTPLMARFLAGCDVTPRIQGAAFMSWST